MYSLQTAYFHNEYDWSNGVKKTQEQNAKQTLVRWAARGAYASERK